MPTTSNCPFCDIINHAATAEVLYENQQAVAILDIRPIHLGHALVIPKHHCATFLDLPADSLRGLMEATQLVSRAIVAGLGLEGFNIFSNNGKIAGQSVFHFHWHLIPRHKDDSIRLELKFKQYSEGQMAAFGQRIRESIHSTVS